MVSREIEPLAHNSLLKETMKRYSFLQSFSNELLNTGLIEGICVQRKSRWIHVQLRGH